MASASATTSPDAFAPHSSPVHPTTPSRLTARFHTLAREGRKALVCYTTAGYPDPQSSIALLRGLAEAGADVIEIGVPFSDPMADGPVIQHSSQIALEHGITLALTLDLVREAALPIPVVLFSYLNPILAGGEDVLLRARAAGVDGVLATDLPVGADPLREAWFGASGLDFVRLVAPTTPAPRMEEIARHGGGFVYLISRLGVTGERDALPEDLPETVQRLRGHGVAHLHWIWNLHASACQGSRGARGWRGRRQRARACRRTFGGRGHRTHQAMRAAIDER